MHRFQLTAFLFTLCSFTTACDAVSDLAGGDGNNTDGDGKKSAEKKEKKGKKGKASSGCKLDESTIKADLTIEEDCKLEVETSITVAGGATLTIEAGATLAFAPGNYLSIEDAKLVIAGTKKKPVTLTSNNADKAAGDWIGVFFASETLNGNRIENAVIKFAGQDAGLGRGAITINGDSTQNRIAITRTTFSDNARAAISADGAVGAFSKFADNRFSSNTISLSAPAETLGSVGEGNRFGDPVETWGQVGKSAKWPAFGVPIRTTGSVTIGSTTAPPTLTLAEGTTMQFAPGSYLSVGDDKGGSLIAPGCTFTSNAESPEAGDWVGLFVYKLTQRLDLSGAKILAAGNDGHGGRGAITFYDVDVKDARNIELKGLAVENTKSAALASPDRDCGALAEQVTSSGVPVCRTE